MSPCEAYQPQLLDYLYDVLDAGERGPLEQHLTGCAACQAALDRARRHQRLLARAAKARFPSVRFDPPAAVPLTSPKGTVRPARRWAGWMAAAAALLAVALPSGWLGVEYRARHRAVQDAYARYEGASQSFVRVTAEREAALTRSAEAVRDAHQQLAGLDER